MKFIMRRRRAGRKALASVIGSIVIFSVLLTVGYGFFYLESQLQQSLFGTNLRNSSNGSQQGQEHIAVTGDLSGATLGFSTNNTGVATIIVSYVIIDRSTGQVSQFNSGSSSNPSLPYELSQGQSQTFKTGVLYSTGHTYAIEVLTSRGSEFVGTYPSKQLGTNVVSSLIAAGFGSISMNFGSYTLYSYSQMNGPPVVNLAQPHPATLIPDGIYPIFSLTMTNNDPSAGTITINSHSDVYLYSVCSQGCGGGVPIFSYFLVNVAPNGTITSTTQGSFASIQIPVGGTKTVYFASHTDLSLGSFTTISMSTGTKVPLGEYDVFVIISGTDTSSQNSILYAQNLPFAGSYLADNVAYLSETPVTCTHSTPTSFSLTVQNWQTGVPSSFGLVNTVTLIASSLSSVSASAPNSVWSVSVNSGTITWSTTNSGQNGEIRDGNQLNFTWSGTPPSSVGALMVFPIITGFTKGIVISQQDAAGCFTM